VAITQVGTSTHGTSQTSGSITVSKPGGASLQAGDVILAFGLSAEGAWDTLPSGFTQFTVSTDASTPDNMRGYGWYKVCGGSEPASYSFGNSNAASLSTASVVTMSAWRGVDNANPILDLSVQTTGSVTDPTNGTDITTAFTQSGNGRLFYARMVRFNGGSGNIPAITVSTTGWDLNDSIGEWSGGTVNYTIGVCTQQADTGTGNRVEPTTTCNKAETTNFLVLGTLKTAVDPSTGTMDMTTPSLNNAGTVFAGTMTTPSGDITMSTPSLNNAGTVFDGIAAPPSGSMDVQTPSITATFAGNSIGGSFGMQVPSITSDFEAGVEPIGPIGVTLPMLDVGFTVETTPFGGNVIRPDHESRAFRVIDPDPGLIYLKHRSQVTDA
jgi:hypothetical protein